MFGVYYDTILFIQVLYRVHDLMNFVYSGDAETNVRIYLYIAGGLIYL